MSLRRIGRLTEGERFAVARRRARVGQMQLELESGVFQTIVSAFERGKVELPQDRVDELWSALERLAERQRERVSA